MRSKIVCSSALLVALLAGGVSAQPSAPCDQERGELRWLVQHYALQRTALEFQLARSEARRQSLEAEVERLRQPDKSAPSGQIPGGVK